MLERMLPGAAALLADAAWIAIAFTLVGRLFAQPEPLLPFWAVLLLLAGAAALSMWLAEQEDGEHSESRPTRSRAGSRLSAGPVLAGVLLVGLLVQAGPAAREFDGLWIVGLVQGKLDGTSLLGLGLEVMGGIFVWRRGLTSTRGALEARLPQIFLVGSVFFVLAALSDAVCGDCGLFDFALCAIFFAGSLFALACAQLPADDGKASAWHRSAAGIIALVFGVTFAVLELSAAFGHSLSVAVGGYWRVFVEAVVDVLMVVLGPLVVWTAGALEWIVQTVGSGGAQINPADLQSIHRLRPDESSLAFPTRVIEVLLVLLIGMLALWGFTRAVRYARRQTPNVAFDDRESLEQAEDAGWIELLAELLPSWLRRRSTTAVGEGWHYPEGRPGFTEVFQLYVEMLRRAADSGWEYDARLTPRERMAALQAALPGYPVRELTRCFERACYGELALSPADIDQLETRLRSYEP